MFVRPMSRNPVTNCVLRSSIAYRCLYFSIRRCTRARSAAKLKGRMPRAASTPDAELTPDDLMRQLAAEHGVRVLGSPERRVFSTHVQAEWDEDEDEDESWEDVVADLGNPWDMRPARVGLFEDSDDVPGVNPPALSSSSASAAAAQLPASPYSDPTALIRIGRRDLMKLADLGPPEAAAAAAAAAGAGGLAGGWGGLELAAEGEAGGDKATWAVASGRGRVALLDVRELGEEGKEEVEAEVDPGIWVEKSKSAQTAPGWPLRRPPGWVAAAWGLPRIRLPLSSLRRPQASALAAAWEVLVVASLGLGDVRAEQAVVRMTKVYGLRRVVLYDDGLE